VSYQDIRVWQRLSERSCVRYSCFKDLSTGKYGVQSADFYRLPVDEQLRRQHDIQFFELFMEEDPQERCAWFDSLEAAIEAHDEQFV
jgi:hypothetical protein